MSTREFRLPDLGEGLTEAEVLRWLVKVGDTVAVDQPVVEVETAKASVEVPSPFGGVVAELHAAEGGTVDVGAPLISITSDSSQSSGNVLVGYGTTEGGRGRRGRRRPPAPPVSNGSRPPAPSVPHGGRPPAPPVPNGGRPLVISPIVRKLARDHHVDLTSLTGTAPGGVIARRDVEGAIAATRPAVVEPGLERVPLRKAAADLFTRSRREIPDTTTWVDVDATGLVELRRELLSRDPERPLGILALIARFVVAGLARYPDLNSRVDLDAGEIVRLPGVNLGIAAQGDRGLMVPVVHDAHRRNARELHTEIARLAKGARAGDLVLAELTGGTFTLNNYGVFKVDGATPIINHPETALLGVGRILDRPWVVDGEVVPRKIAQFSLTFDHRVCDGATAAAFLRFVVDCVEHPAQALALL